LDVQNQETASPISQEKGTDEPLPVELGEMTEYFLSRQKVSTARTYRTAFRKFARFFKGPVDRFIIAVDKDNGKPLEQRKTPYAEPILIDWKEKLLEEEYSAKSIRTFMGSIQGLCKKNHVFLTLAGVGLPPDEEESETIAWTSADHVAKYLSLFKVQAYQTVGVLMFQSGLSIGDALGVRYGLISEELEKGVCPLCFDFHRKGRSKTGVKFVTFAGEWTIRSLLGYIGARKLGSEDKIFGSIWKEQVESYFLSRARQFVGTWKGRNNPASPHSLRHGFRSIIHASQLVRDSDLEFFMGHGHRSENKIETQYTDLEISTWRKLYSPALAVLEPSFILKGKHNGKAPIPV
jgi:integrase